MRIMYRTNLNFVTFRKYFSVLLDRGLIAEVKNGEGNTLYRTTEKGKTALDMLNKIQKVVSL